MLLLPVKPHYLITTFLPHGHDDVEIQTPLCSATAMLTRLAQARASTHLACSSGFQACRRMSLACSHGSTACPSQAASRASLPPSSRASSFTAGPLMPTASAPSADTGKGRRSFRNVGVATCLSGGGLRAHIAQ